MIDYVVSSLPLAVLDDEVKDSIISQALTRLKPDGQFIQFQYSLKPFRCHRITVSGLTMVSILAQSAQILDSRTQKSRSLFIR